MGNELLSIFSIFFLLKNSDIDHKAILKFIHNVNLTLDRNFKFMIINGLKLKSFCENRMVVCKRDD